MDQALKKTTPLYPFDWVNETSCLRLNTGGSGFSLCGTNDGHGRSGLHYNIRDGFHYNIRDGIRSFVFVNEKYRSNTATTTVHSKKMKAPTAKSSRMEDHALTLEKLGVPRLADIFRRASTAHGVDFSMLHALAHEALKEVAKMDCGFYISESILRGDKASRGA